VTAEGNALGDSGTVQSSGPVGCEVFISYSGKDATVSEDIAAAIEQLGPRVWAFSRESETVLGGDWYIEHELPMLAACQVVVFVVSRHFALSPACHDELRRTVDPNRHPRKRFYAVVVDGIDLSQTVPMSPEVDYAPSMIWELLQNRGSMLLGRTPTAAEIESIAKATLRLLRPAGEVPPKPQAEEETRKKPISLPVTERWASSGSSVLVVVNAHSQGASSARRWLHREYPNRIYGADSWRFGRALYLEEVKPALERLSGAVD